MEEKQSQKKIIMIALLVAIITLVLGASYAYFLAQGQSAEQTVTTSNLGITFGDGTAIMNASDIAPLIREDALPIQDSSGKVTTPGKAVTKKFTIENTGTEKMYIHISLEDMTLPEDLKRYDFLWSLYEVTDTTNNIEKNVSNGSFDGSGTSLMVAPYQVFEVGEEKTYSLYIWIEETYLNQSAIMGQTFKATIQAEGEAYYTSPESDFVVNEEGVLTAYNGTDTDIIIPPVVNGITVTSIGFEAFVTKDLTNVVIPNTITSIGSTSFAGNQLTTLFIPNSVTTIENDAFVYNQLNMISIPNSVTNLKSCFSGNKLTSIFIPNSTSSIMNYSFSDNPIENIIIPNSVTSIGDRAFLGHKMNTIVIPSSVTTIEDSFYSEELEVPITIIVLGKSSAPSGFSAYWYNTGNGLKNQVIYKP